MPICEKNYSWSPSTCTWENGNYLGSIICDSVITYDKIREVNKTFSKKKKTVPRKTVVTKTVPRKPLPTNFNNNKGNL